MSKIGYFHYVKNKNVKFRHLACIQEENRNAVANLKSHRVPIPSIMNEKKFSNQYMFLKAKGKTKSNHEVLGLWQRSLRPHDIIDF